MRLESPSTLSCFSGSFAPGQDFDDEVHLLQTCPSSRRSSFKRRLGILWMTLPERKELTVAREALKAEIARFSSLKAEYGERICVSEKELKLKSAEWDLGKG